MNKCCGYTEIILEIALNRIQKVQNSAELSMIEIACFEGNIYIPFLFLLQLSPKIRIKSPGTETVLKFVNL